MPKELWASVDDYMQGLFLQHDEGLDAVLAANRAAGLPAIDVAPNQGKLLCLLAQMLGARNILEIGTLGGYSTIWLARALPAGGKIVSLEADPKHAEVARTNLSCAGLTDVVDVRVGRALDSLPTLAGQVFDLVFIDADKPNNARYIEWALRLTRPGSVIVVDNVVREGRILDEASTDPRVQGTRSMFDLIAQEPRLNATAIQTVGRKGYDGLVVARVVSTGRTEAHVAPSIAIRKAEESDLSAILDLYAQDELSTSPRPEDVTPIQGAFRAIASDPHASLFVATEGGRAVGTFQMNILRHLTQGGAPVAQIEAVAVSPVSRGQGIGREMMRFAIDEARRLGCIRAQLTSQKRRARAHVFYERLGFERSHEGMKLKL